MGHCTSLLFGAIVAGELRGEATMTAPLVNTAATQFDLR
jgi:hypothetical protein